MIRLYFFISIILLQTTLFAQQKCSQNNMYSKTTATDSIDVLHYEIDLDIIYLSQHKIDGNTKLQIIPKYNNTSSISLDLQHLTVDSIFINNNKNQNWIHNDTLISIQLSSIINTTDTIDCQVYYHGNPQKDPSGWGGFYFSNDTTFAFNMAVGMQDDPHNYGRIWYPCADNFTDRATYGFNITVKNDKFAICNGTLENTSTSTNTKTYTWQLHNNIPTYLASVAIGPYVAVEDTFISISGDTIPIAIYVTQDKVAAANGSFGNLKQILNAFEHYYGPYRWERIGYVGVPFSSGAMEHATTIHIGNGYINGNKDYETLIAHELSHHWFGDLVTCQSAPDMWLNEGWASFSEAMYQEYLYGRAAYVDYMRDMHYNVIKSAHNADNGYRAVAGVPHEYTYGSTVYKKGATVAHSIRGYLGDDKFFSMLNAYMSQNAYKDQSSIQFRDFITTNTGINMDDFFNSWVFEEGFSEFYANSYSIVSSTNSITKVNVTARQGLHHKPNYANSNRMPITFMDDNWNRKDTILQFSGQNGSENFDLDFEPTVVFTDLNHTFADATIDYDIIIKNTGSKNYNEVYYKMNVQQVSDSALFQITHHWAAPDTLGTSYPGLRISTKRYWTIAANNIGNYKINASFRYQKSGELDSDIILSSQDSVILLYRPNSTFAWQKINFEKQGGWVAGYLNVEDIKPGEYSVAVYDYNYLGINENDVIKNIELKISPNPGADYFNFEGNFNFQTNGIIYDTAGRVVHKFRFISNEKTNTYRWDASNLSSGAYFIKVFTEDNTVIYQSKIIKN